MARGYLPGVQEMLDMGVWRHVKSRDHPQDHRLVGCRWVFKVTRNGVYHARLVAKGFSQIPVWISQITTPQWLMMSLSELWWQECLLKI